MNAFVTPVTLSFLECHACKPSVYAGCDAVTPVTATYMRTRARTHVRVYIVSHLSQVEHFSKNNGLGV